MGMGMGMGMGQPMGTFLLSIQCREPLISGLVFLDWGTYLYFAITLSLFTLAST